MSSEQEQLEINRALIGGVTKGATLASGCSFSQKSGFTFLAIQGRSNCGTDLTFSP
jgi:hypothetical protein